MSHSSRRPKLLAVAVAMGLAASGLVVVSANAAQAGPSAPRRHKAVEVRVLAADESAVIPARRQPALSRADLRLLGVEKARGATRAPDGTVYVLDVADASVVTAPAGEPGRKTSTQLTGVEAGRLGALAFNPADGRLYAADSSADTVYALDSSGRVTDTYAVRESSLGGVSTMTFAPTTDPTDDPSATNLFVADATGGADATVAEVSLTLAEVVVPPTAKATLINKTLTSTYTPPSPDTSDIAYIPSENRLLMTDGEVDEMPIFAGVNMWASTLAGAQLDTGTTMAYSPEPTGFSYDAERDRILVSDDDKDVVTTSTRGPDGKFGTADDVRSSFKLTVAGVADPDPESLAVDTKGDQLFIADGEGTDVYRVSFAGEVLDRWDVSQYGAADPEGITYDPSRDLLMLLDDTSEMVYEMTKTGALVDAVDVQAATMGHAAGITVAPASSGNGKQSMYIVDRGVDNNVDPTENDGVMEELSSPTLPLAGNVAPTVNAGVDQVVTHPGPATLRGTATDDGKPNPPARLSTSWTKVSGPGDVTFGNAAALSTTATFSAPGTYYLRLAADDGDVSTYDDLRVISNAPPQAALTVTPTSGTPPLLVTADASGSTDTDSLGIADYRFDFGDGTAPVTQATPSATHTYTAGGSYRVTVTVRDSGGLTGTATVSVRVNGTPTVSAGPDRLVTFPANASLAGTASDDGQPDPPRTLTTRWTKLTGPGIVTFGDAGQPATTAAFSTPGTYVLRLTADDSVLAATDDVKVISNGPPTAALNVTTTSGNEPLVVTADASGSTDTDGIGINSYKFEFGDGSSSVTQATPSVTHTYAVKGDYVLTVTVTDAAGLSDTESAAVSVNGTPTVSAGPDQLDQPFPGTVSLVGRATDDGRPNPPGALSYRWSKVSGPGSVTFGTGTAASTSATFSAQGVYVLRLTVNDSAATASDDVVVEMNAAPVAGLSVSPYSGMAPHTVTVDASGSADAAPRDIASYTFDFGDGSSPVTQPATDATVDHVYTAEGRFTVKVTVTDTGGRASQSTRRVLVGPNLAARAVTPSRILDTRTGNGAPAAMLGGGQTLTLQVQGRGGLPASGVQAAVMNMTVTAPGTAGYLTVWPSGDSRPTASNLNFAKGATVANLVQTRVGSDGKVQIYNGSGKPVHVIADVSAWFGAQAAPDDDRGVFAPVSPYRALDTRTSGGPLGGAGVRTLKVTGTGGATGVPASGVEAVVLNVVAVSPTKSGYLTVYPGDKSRPTASNVNFVAGRTLANRVVVPVGSDGTVKIFNSTGRTNVVVDVSGWYTATGGTSALGSLYGTRGPQRLADSRTGSGGLSTFGPGATETLQVSGRAGVPGAGSARKPTAVVLNVTAVGPTRSGYLTVYPADLATRPTASDINFTAGQSVPNLVLVRLPANGKLRLFNSVGTTNVVVDVQGWYAGS